MALLEITRKFSRPNSNTNIKSRQGSHKTLFSLFAKLLKEQAIVGSKHFSEIVPFHKSFHKLITKVIIISFHFSLSLRKKQEYNPVHFVQILQDD